MLWISLLPKSHLTERSHIQLESFAHLLQSPHSHIHLLMMVMMIIIPVIESTATHNTALVVLLFGRRFSCFFHVVRTRCFLRRAAPSFYSSITQFYRFAECAQQAQHTVRCSSTCWFVWGTIQNTKKHSRSPLRLFVCLNINTRHTFRFPVTCSIERHGSRFYSTNSRSVFSVSKCVENYVLNFLEIVIF